SSAYCHVFSLHGHHRHLHSFPTRRSSDLARHAHTGTNGSAAQSKCHRVRPLVSHRDGTAPQWRAHYGQEFVRHRGRGAGCRTNSDRKSTRLNSSHRTISYAVFCLKKKKKK